MVRKKFVSPLVQQPLDEKKTETPKKKIKATSSTTNGAKSKDSKSPSSKSDAKEPNTKNEEDLWQYWQVMHTKRSNKKHKTYDDGFLIIQPKKFILLDSQGKKLTEKTESNTGTDWKEGNTLTFGTKEIEFLKRLSSEAFNSGSIFLNDSKSSNASSRGIASLIPKTKKFKSHKSVNAEIVKRPKAELQTPPNVTILNQGHTDADESGQKTYDVYIDPFLQISLRPHQLEGIRFMYECIMGCRDFNGYGCLLADEMGLGKTVQTIALIYTLANRGPKGCAVLHKSVIVTNSGLVTHWNKEFKKWVGSKIQVLVCTSKGKNSDPTDILKTFKNGYHKVLILSYNMCVLYAKALKEIDIDLLVCDEGHKLKNNNIKIFKVLKELQTRRRIVLSGTPLQNDLNEFFCICDFINPGLLGDASSFRNIFADPINKSREPGASETEKRIGLARSQQLNKLMNQFLLRRTSHLLNKHLPPKYEIFVFCKMTNLQKDLYKHFLQSKYLFNMLTGGGDESSNALACIQNLKKLLTHPNMIHKVFAGSNEGEDDDIDDQNFIDEAWKGALALFPTDYNSNQLDPNFSGKMKVLSELLEEIIKEKDRVVIVSNFTSILDQVQILCEMNGHELVRHDGKTSTDKRNEAIDSFNNPKSNVSVMLLSSKSGGCGLNLTGGNRLILFDPDWNPSTDLQAMARVWRDGQKKKVFIYRFITTGTIEEKILQRQIVKQGLSKTVVDEKSMKAAFSKDVLRQIFTLNEDCICETFSEDAKKSDNIGEELSETDPLLFKTIQSKEHVSFVKISKENDDEAFRLVMMAENNEGDSVGDSDDGADAENNENNDRSDNSGSQDGEQGVSKKNHKRKADEMEEGESEYVFEDEGEKENDVTQQLSNMSDDESSNDEENQNRETGKKKKKIP